MRVENVYTAVACNRTPECADWGNNGLIIFGACNAVGILNCKYKDSSAKILHTYVRHKKRVNTVRWLRTTEDALETHFITGADDSLAIFWDVKNLDEPICHILKGHESGVNAVDGVMQKSGIWLLATAAADSKLKIWHMADDQIECLQTLYLSNGFCLTLRVTLLPKSEQVILAYSGDDESVSLWTQAAINSQEFQRVHKLVGHEDWVRGLDFIRDDDDDLLLASSAQDNFIRLWRISSRSEAQVRENKIDIMNAWDESKEDLRVEEKIIQTAEKSWYAVSLESVLYGHDGWVYGVHWHKTKTGDLRLLSASIDKTLIIWTPTEDGVWLEKVRVGEVGGNSLGFFGGKFSSDGKSIMGHSYQGGFHVWNQSLDDEHLWTPNVIVGGHFDEVRDLAWEPQGAYVMSVSADQTTRIHAPWVQQVGQEECTWHEIARPQVHGYDMQALAILSRYKFASGAEEKIVRTFQSSANFIENFRRLTKYADDIEGNALLESLPKGASVPSLGLSNKAVYSVEAERSAEGKHIKDEYPENYFVPVLLDTPPQEETLMQNTLWPEVQKLYGHGYEIYALAATNDGHLLASSCRATTGEHAQIILWNTTTWKQIQKLPSHQLTVTQMRFSPDGRYLLSVSRDRRWSLFERQGTGDTSSNYDWLASTDKTNGVHTRIIWACDWSHDSKLFVTTSREGKAVIWSKDSSDTVKNDLNGWHSLASIELKGESITAVGFASKLTKNGSYVLALGLESGVVQIYSFNGQWKLECSLIHDQAHHLTVKRLQFRPLATLSSNEFHLASCADDHLVRIYKFYL